MQGACRFFLYGGIIDMKRQGTKKEKRNIIKENAYIFKDDTALVCIRGKPYERKREISV
ncbi:hypothetical protein PMEGAPR236_08860 [Priestia megaterium]